MTIRTTFCLGIGALTLAMAACTIDSTTVEDDGTGGSTSSTTASGSGGAGQGGAATVGSGGSGGGEGGEGGGEAGGGGEGGGVACEPFTAGSTSASYSEDDDYLGLEAQTSDVEPYDVLDFELYFDFGASDELAAYQPYTFGAEGFEGYDECVVCLRIFAGCVETVDAIECDHIFMPESGTVNLTALGQTGEDYAGALANVHLVEVDIDEETDETTVIDGGEERCISTFSFDETVVALDPPAEE